MNKGRIVQVMGPVVDVVFEDGNLPYIKDALEVENNGKKCIMEVAQHLGNNEVRCLMLAASEGLHKDMEVTATGAGIKVPVVLAFSFRIQHLEFRKQPLLKCF